MNGSTFGGDSRGDEKLRDELKYLEGNYLGQPSFVQQDDLAEINKIRSRLGMRPVDDELVEIKDDEEDEAQDSALKPETTDEVDPHLDFVREELLPGADAPEQRSLVKQILDTLFDYDPGVGINRP